MIPNKVNQIVIADTQFLIVEALQSIIQKDDRYVVAGVAGVRTELLNLLGKNGDALLIIDFANVDFDSMVDLKSIRLNYPQIAILILTNSVSKAELASLTRLGIKNIIYKTADKDEILFAIESALKGKKYYSDEILDQLLDPGETKNGGEIEKHLTSSEIEIVKLIANGLTTKEIASKKSISYHTVNTHRKNIFRKLDVSNVSELTMYAIKAGWINNIEYYI